MLRQLVDGEKSAGELARLLGVKEAAMSQQLAVLRRRGLARSRREGQTVHYGLARGDVRRLLEFLYDTYCCPVKANGGDEHAHSELDADQRQHGEEVA